MNNNCKICNDIIPEGLEYCPKCYQKKQNIRTNLDAIRLQSADELAYDLINPPTCKNCWMRCGTEECYQRVKSWLLKEVDKQE